MKRIMTNRALIVIAFMAITQQLFMVMALKSVPLPLMLPFPYTLQTRDVRWTDDAKQANANMNHFVEPDDGTPYAHYRYVGSHNAFTDANFFKIARQQDQPILGQLTYGVRGFMLDTYNWDQGWPFTMVGPSNAKVCLSHSKPGFIALVQKGTNEYQSMKYEIRRIVEFMRLNPQAVITIILENYADNIQSAKEISDVMVEAGYDVLFRPADLISLNGQWPTLGWMRANNKRLVVFTQRGGLDLSSTFVEFKYMTENVYSTTDESALCAERAESRGAGSLVVFNNFPGIGVTTPVLLAREQARYDTVKRIITNCKARGFAKGRIFNGYWIDRVVDACNCLYGDKQKTVFEYVNELNANPDKTMP